MAPSLLLAESSAGIAVLRGLSVEQVMLPLLLQLTMIILAARLFGGWCGRLGQPRVVGEILAGLILGPSVLGRIVPGLFDTLFHPRAVGVPPQVLDVLLTWMLTTLSQLGLIFLLFLIGLEFEIHHLRRQGRLALSIASAGIVVPFFLGLGLGAALHSRLAPELPRLGFVLFLGTALSITAIPALGRIMMELNITRTRLGTLTMTAAAVDDALGWILLASVAAIVRADFQWRSTLWLAGATLALALCMLGILRPVLERPVRQAMQQSHGELTNNGFALLIAGIFACALVTSWIGIFAVFGAFLLGITLAHHADLRSAVSRRLGGLVSAFFLPIYFTYTGLRTDIGTLGSIELGALAVLVCLTAIIGKFGGCGLAAYLGGLSLRESGCVGALMNTRGLMALVAINMGRDLGVIPESVFCMLVIMALFTTLMTAPLLLRFMPGTELEAPILQSGFRPRPLGRVSDAAGLVPSEKVSPAANP